MEEVLTHMCLYVVLASYFYEFFVHDCKLGVFENRNWVVKGFSRLLYLFYIWLVEV